MPTDTQALILFLVAGAVGLAVIATFFTVEQRTIAMVQRLGKFVREAGPGLHVKVPFIAPDGPQRRECFRGESR